MSHQKTHRVHCRVSADAPRPLGFWAESWYSAECPGVTCEESTVTATAAVLVGGFAPIANVTLKTEDPDQWDAEPSEVTLTLTQAEALAEWLAFQIPLARAMLAGDDTQEVTT